MLALLDLVEAHRLPQLDLLHRSGVNVLMILDREAAPWGIDWRGRVEPQIVPAAVLFDREARLETANLLLMVRRRHLLHARLARRCRVVLAPKLRLLIVFTWM